MKTRLSLLIPILFTLLLFSCPEKNKSETQILEQKNSDDSGIKTEPDSIAKARISSSHTTVPSDGVVYNPPKDNKDCTPFNILYYKPSQRHIMIGLSVSKVNHQDLVISDGSSTRGTETSNPKPVESKPEDSKYKKYKLTDSKNLFTTSENKIHLEIPISNPKLWIKSVVNISNYEGDSKVNAILILLAPSDEIYEETRDSPTLLIKTDLEISKISGLRKDLLKLHQKLKVYIYYDDNITNCIIDDYKNCVQHNEYSSIFCPLNLPPGTVGAPREQGGGVIGGSGG
nr:hypothetical protein [uncultured Psychroserpens sp.]